MTNEEKVLSVLNDEPQKQTEILKQLRNRYQLKMTDRNLRKVFYRINKDFINNISERMVISNSNGCWLSNDSEEIQRYNRAKKHQALSTLYQVYHSEKRLALDEQIPFEEFLKCGEVHD